jgi:hypothetical protein
VSAPVPPAFRPAILRFNIASQEASGT